MFRGAWCIQSSNDKIIIKNSKVTLDIIVGKSAISNVNDKHYKVKTLSFMPVAVENGPPINGDNFCT